MKCTGSMKQISGLDFGGRLPFCLAVPFINPFKMLGFTLRGYQRFRNSEGLKGSLINLVVLD